MISVRESDRMYDWEDTGLFFGLSNERKLLCSKAFDEVFLYLEANQHNLNVSIEDQKEMLVKKNFVSMVDLKRLFVKNKINLDWNLLLYPMVRKVIGSGKSFDLYRFLNHCQNKLQVYDLSKLPKDADVEAELCIYLTNSF